MMESKIIPIKDLSTAIPSGAKGIIPEQENMEKPGLGELSLKEEHLEEFVRKILMCSFLVMKAC